MRTDIYDDILSVFQLNEYVRRSLAADPFLSMLRVSGEISNFKRHTSGHMYFTLKDDQAQVRCVMFRQDAFALEFAPKDGDHVLLRASASLYAQAGQYQLYVRGMTPMGMGALHLRFEALKRALGEEGLFDAAHKKPLPFFPASVGIATSQTGAALQDMLRILRERNPAVDILVAPCQVQGKGAERTIISAMRRLADAKADVIIIGRGGGSLEDLWAFNEESLARAVYDCAVPVISAVGHETDYTMTDFCADARAATPSNAAEIAVPVLEDLRNTIDARRRALDRNLRNALGIARSRVALLGHRLSAHDPRQIYRLRRQSLYQAEMALSRAMKDVLAEKRQKWERLALRLEGLRPESVLKRGYAIVRREGRPLRSVSELRAGDPVEILLRDGRFGAEVKDVTS